MVGDLAARGDPDLLARFDMGQRLIQIFGPVWIPIRKGCRQIDMTRPVTAPSS